MNIKELDDFQLTKAINFNDNLNPQLFLNEKMRSNIRAKLLDIANAFREFIGVENIALVDITLSGSNAAYSYTPHSDIDLHLIVDFTQLPDSDVYKELFDAKKYSFNDQHDIKIKGYGVELYIQDAAQVHSSLGEYSVMNDQWNRIPTKQRANLNDTATKLKYEKLKTVAIRALASDNEQYLLAVLDIIKRYRRAGLSQNGEFGPENLAFKMIRTDGLFAKLWAKRREHTDSDLSLEQRVEEPDSLAQKLMAEFERGATEQTIETIIKQLYNARESLFDDFNYDYIYESAASIHTLSESEYSGNLGLEEIIEFYRVATKKQANLLKQLIDAGELKKGWMLIQKITGMKLKGEQFNEVAKSYQPPKIDVGDEVKVGKFKNRKATVKGFDIDKDNQPVLKTTKGDHKLFKPKISKLELELEEQGRIVKGVNTTCDVDVDEIKVQAKKMGFDVTIDGVPPLLMELNMAPGRLQKQVNSIIKSADPVIGVEFEICIVRDTVANPDITKHTNFDDIKDFFIHNTESDLEKLHASYDDWLSEKQYAWAEEQTKDTLNNPMAEDTKKEEIMTNINTSSVADDAIAKITGDKDNITLTSDIARETLVRAQAAYKSNGNANEWPLDKNMDPYLLLYYDIFIGNDEDAKEQIFYVFIDEFYNTELQYTDTDYSVGRYLMSLHINSMGDLYFEFEDIWFWPGGPMHQGAFDEELAQQLASNLEDIVGDTVEVEGDSNYGDINTSTTWVITSDDTIKPNEGDSGLEIITPIMRYEVGVETVKDVINYLKEIGAYANESTGLHINVSFANINPDNLDYAKLVIMLGDSYVLKQFGREFNEYAGNALVKLSNEINFKQGYERDKEPRAEAFAKMMVGMRSNLSNSVKNSFGNVSFGKFTSVGLRDDYIEFRSAGGADYIHDFDAILASINRFIVVYAIAMDPNAYRKEYGKKLYKLASNVSDGQASKSAMTLFAGFGSGMITKDELIKQLKARRTAQVDTTVDTGEPKVPTVRREAIQMVADKHSIEDNTAEIYWLEGEEIEYQAGLHNQSNLDAVFKNLMKDLKHYKAHYE